MNIQRWIEWAYVPAKYPHKLSSVTQARQASRDLSVVVAVADFEAAMSEYVLGNQDKWGENHYCVEDSEAKRRYEWRRYTLVEPIPHPLTVPDPRDAFYALPEQDQKAVLDWIANCIRPVHRLRTVNAFRYPCSAMTGLDLDDAQMRGALLVAGLPCDRNQFRCCLTDEALRNYRITLRANQPLSP